MFEDKLLGCMQKVGIFFVVDVLKYGEVFKIKGLMFLSVSGNDLIVFFVLVVVGC